MRWSFREVCLRVAPRIASYVRSNSQGNCEKCAAMSVFIRYRTLVRGVQEIIVDVASIDFIGVELVHERGKARAWVTINGEVDGVLKRDEVLHV